MTVPPLVARAKATAEAPDFAKSCRDEDGLLLHVLAGRRALERGAELGEAELVRTEHGLVPKGQGWFVVNARETQWWERNGRGVLCEFEGAGFVGATDFL